MEVINPSSNLTLTFHGGLGELLGVKVLSFKEMNYNLGIFCFNYNKIPKYTKNNHTPFNYNVG